MTLGNTLAHGLAGGQSMSQFEDINNIMTNINDSKRYSRAGAFRNKVNRIKNILKHGLVYEFLEGDARGKNKKTYYMAVGYVPIPKSNDFILAIFRVDAKNPWREGIKGAIRFTQHAIARGLQTFGIMDVIDLFKLLHQEMTTQVLFEYENCHESNAMLLSKGVMIFDDNETVKTFISYNSMVPKQAEHLQRLRSQHEGNGVVIKWKE